MTDLDDALARFQMCGFETGDHRPNYGPMTAHALVALGHSALVTGWIDFYAPRLPVLGPGRAFSRDGWQAALGRSDEAADWVATFEAEIEAKGWHSTLAVHLPRLAEGLCESTLHALVRLAYAIRALEAVESAERLRELAFGLAWWAMNNRAAPPPEEDRRAGAPATLDPIVRRSVGIYLGDPDHRVANTVLVTAPNAIRTLAPHLETGAYTRAVALLEFALPVDEKESSLAVPAHSGDEEVERCAKDPDEIRYRAACSLQEHAIVFTDACLREAAILEDPQLYRAAADAALRVAPEGYRDWSKDR